MSHSPISSPDGRNRRPEALDPISKWLWYVYIPVDHTTNSIKQFKRECWQWKGSLAKTGTPRFKDKDTGGQRYVSARQWLMVQMHPESIPHTIKMTCDQDHLHDPTFECVNPFHMTQVPGTRPRGRVRKDPIQLAFPETKNRMRLFYHVWVTLMTKEAETLRQRSLPQYLD